MWRLALRSMRLNLRRLLGTSLAVLVGVAFLVGTVVLGDTMNHGFDAAFGTANSTTDVVVRSTSVIRTEQTEQRDPVAASLADDLVGVAGVARVDPQIQGVTQLLDLDGEPIGGDGPPTYGGGWIDAAVNPFRLTSGRAPRAEGEVVVDRGTATAAKLRLGSRTTALVPAAVPVEVVGIAALDGVESLGGATFTFFSPEEARRLLLAGRDEASTLVVSAEPGTDVDELVRRVAAVLPEGTEALSGVQLTAEQVSAVNDDFLGVLRTFLLVFSGIAVLVATFSIHNTFSVITAQRSRESALLRAVGATRRQVVGVVTLESAATGLVASLVGVVAGLGLADGLLRLMASAGFDLPSNGLTVRPAGLVVGVVVGFVTTVVAGLLPALEAGRIPPIAALRSSAAEAPEVPWRRIVVGVVLVVGGLVVVSGPALGWWTAPIVAVGGGALAVLVGTLVAGPAMVRRVVAVVGAPLSRLRGITGDLARENARRSPRRTARTAAALVVGVGVVTLFSVVGASMVASVEETVAGSMQADLVVQSSGFTGPGLDPRLAERLAQLPEVDVASAFETGAVRVGKESLDAVVVDPATVDRVVDPEVVAGSLADLGDDGLAVSAELADAQGWTVGERATVGFGDGAVRDLRVAARYERTELLDDLVLPAAVWAEHRTQPSVRIVLVQAAAGVDVEAARVAVDRVGSAVESPAAMDRGEFVDDIAGEIGQVLSIIYVLLALSVIIALMGIANTISLSVHERRREIGLLRAVGQARSQTRSMVRWEAAVISAFGTLCGVAVGLVSAWGIVAALSGDGALTTFSAPASQLVLIVVVGAIVGVLAGARPARRAARLPVLDALAA